MRRIARLALATIMLAGRAAPSTAAPTALHQAGRWLVDVEGRVVILHGVNQVSKLPPYLPSAIGFGADDVAFIAGQGFNTVRTGLAHKGFVPVPGTYDTAYADLTMSLPWPGTVPGQGEDPLRYTMLRRIRGRLGAHTTHRDLRPQLSD